MKICCLDLEGVLLPEVWIKVAKRFGVEELLKTTRDIPDYDKLMRYRLRILRREKIKLRDIQQVIESMRPLPGAYQFIKKLRQQFPVIILSDTFYEFVGPLMNKLDNPTLFCNWLKTDRMGYVSKYVLRQKDGKRKAVLALRKIGFRVVASGDSYNDLTMLKTAHKGVLFNPPDSIRKAYPRFPVATSYASLLRYLKNA